MIASAGIVLALASVGAQAASASSPAPSPATSTSAAPSAAPIKSIKKRFLLSKSSPVYQKPDAASAVLAHVKRKTHVNVIGITGDWLQIKLPSGTVGFIPAKTAE